MRTRHLLVLLVFLPFAASAQIPLDSLLKVLETAPPDSNRLNTLKAIRVELMHMSRYQECRLYLQETQDLARKLGDRQRENDAIHVRGNTWFYESNLDSARKAWEQSLRMAEERKDTVLIIYDMFCLGNLDASVGNYEAAQKVYLETLRWAEQRHDTGMIINCLMNLGNIAGDQNKTDRSIGQFLRVRNEYGGALDPETRSVLLNNLGGFQRKAGLLDDAEKTFRELHEHATAIGDAAMVTLANDGLGDVARDKGDHNTARERFLDSRRSQLATEDRKFKAKAQMRISSVSCMAIEAGDRAFIDHWFKGSEALALQEARAMLDSAISTFIVIEDDRNLAYTYEYLSQVEGLMGDYKSALEHHRLFKAYSDTLFNAERDTKLTEAAMTYEFEKKEAATRAEQEKKDALSAEELQRKALQRNAFIGGFGLMLLLAGTFFVQRNRVNKARKRSDELLLNILPEEVAEELKAKGEADAKQIDQVTVLFTDFKGFTAMSEQLSPKQLVRDIHECFSAFDHIMAKHGIEKIKTIGDAYMAAGGLPTPNTTHAVDVVKAALEIRDFIAEGKALKIAKGLPYFEIRIGVHTGPVVAGIVGVKKFAYDIWGDTVNIASRMESSGEVGQVNISEETYRLVVGSQLSVVGLDGTTLLTDPLRASRAGQPTTSNRQLFHFTPRGKVQAKGKGEMEMYFVETMIP